MYITIVNNTGSSVVTKSIGLIFQAGAGQGSNQPTWLVRFDDLPRIGKELTPYLSSNFYWWTSDTPMDVRWFGVKADGVTDDTTALQLAFDNARRVIDNSQSSITLYLPTGTTRVTSTIVMYGNSATSPNFIGNYCGENSTSGTGTSTLKWDGSAGGTLFFTQGINSALIQDIHFDGNNKALCCFVYSATTFADRSILAASNDTEWRRCRFQGVQVGTVGAGTVQLGTDPSLAHGDTLEAASGYFHRCWFLPEDPGAPGFSFANMKAWGVKNMSGGNAKIFGYYDCSWLFCNVGIDNEFGSAQVVVTNFQCADVINPLRHGSGELIVHGGDCESGDVSDSHLITGGNDQAGTFAKLHGIEFASFMAGGVGVPGQAVVYGGQLEIEHCYFRNGNAPGGVTNPMRLYIGGEVANLPGQGFSMFRSTQNWYYACSRDPAGATNGYIPVYDNTSNNNPVFPVAHTYGGDQPLQVYSNGDIGGAVETGDTGIFRNFDSNTTTQFETKFNGKIDYSYFTGGGGNSVIGADVENVNLLTYANGGSITVTLPTAVGCQGRWYVVKRRVSSTFPLILAPAGGQTIDGASTYTIKAPYSSIMVFSDGANWHTFGGQFSTTDGDFTVTGNLGVGGNPVYRFEVQGTATGGALAAVQGSSLSSGDILLYLPGPTITGSFSNWITGGANATTGLAATMTNSNNTSSSASAGWNIVTGGASGGNPYLSLTVSGVKTWAIGVNNAASQTFCINRNGIGFGGSDDIIRIDNSGLITLQFGTFNSLINNTPGDSAYSFDTFQSFAGGTNLVAFKNQGAIQGAIDPHGFLTTAQDNFLQRRCGTWMLLNNAATAFTGVGIDAPTSISGTPTSGKLVNAFNSVIYTSGATTGNVAGILAPQGLTAFIFRPRFRTLIRTDGTAVTNQRIFVGLIDSDPSGTTTLAGLNSSHAAILRYDTSLGDTNWQAITSDGTTAVATDTGVAVVHATNYWIDIDMTQNDGKCYFRISLDSVPVFPQVATSSHVPNTYDDISPQISMTTLSNTAQTIIVGKVSVEQN